MQAVNAPSYVSGCVFPEGGRSLIVVRLTDPIRGYAIAADGKRFITVRDNERPPEPPPGHMIVVQNWLEELKLLMSTK